MADKLVVDLVGSSTPGFTKDSLVPIYSSGKSVAPIILAFMKDLGVLVYTQKVTAYWPEYGKNCKEN